MRILFRKISGERHELTIVHPDGRREILLRQTRIVLMHGFIRYALEGGLPSADEAVQIATLERFVGALSGP